MNEERNTPKTSKQANKNQCCSFLIGFQWNMLCGSGCRFLSTDEKPKESKPFLTIVNLSWFKYELWNKSSRNRQGTLLPISVMMNIVIKFKLYSLSRARQWADSAVHLTGLTTNSSISIAAIQKHLLNQKLKDTRNLWPKDKTAVDVKALREFKSIPAFFILALVPWALTLGTKTLFLHLGIELESVNVKK